MDRGKRSAVRCLDDRTVGVRLRWMPPSFLPGPRNGLSERIGRAPHAASAGAVENVRVNHGRFDVRVTQELLDRPDIIAIFDQVGRERVPKWMTTRGAGLRLGRSFPRAIPAKGADQTIFLSLS
jgi:hypothetical protein